HAQCGRDDDQRRARFRARFNRATTLYPVGPRTRTMMQSCASAAKLRSGGPILPFGVRAMNCRACRLASPPSNVVRRGCNRRRQARSTADAALKQATDQNLSEIAQRLEATLRRPAKSSDDARTAAGNPKTTGEQSAPEPFTAAAPSARPDTM